MVKALSYSFNRVVGDVDVLCRGQPSCGNIFDVSFITYNVATFVDYVKRGMITAPVFQRRAVWDVDRRSRYIESLVLGFPVTPLVLAEQRPGSDKLFVLDGWQRTTALVEYVDDKYALSHVVFSQIRGKKFSELSDELRERLLSAKVFAMVITTKREISYDAYIQFLLNFFARMNVNVVRARLFQVYLSSLASPCGEIVRKMPDMVVSGMKMMGDVPGSLIRISRYEHREMLDYAYAATMLVTVAKNTPIPVTDSYLTENTWFAEINEVLANSSTNTCLTYLNQVIAMLILAKESMGNNTWILFEPMTYRECTSEPKGVANKARTMSLMTYVLSNLVQRGATRINWEKLCRATKEEAYGTVIANIRGASLTPNKLKEIGDRILAKYLG